MPSPIIARADALMQRRRNTIADLEDVPVLTDTVNGEEDYPVLLDIDRPPAIAEAEKESEAATEPESVPARDPALEASVRDILAHELARRVEQRLMAEFHVAHDLRRVGRGRGHHVMIIRQPRGGAVIHDDAIFEQHQPVARLANRQRGEGVAIELVEEHAGIAALHVDFAQRRNIAKTNTVAGGEHFTACSGKPILSRAREP